MHDNDRTITPFWRRIPRFFLFPLNPTVLGRVIAYSLLSALPFVLLGSLLFLPLLVAAVLGSWMLCLRHAYLVLEQTSLGRLSTDQYPPQAESGPNKAYKQIAAFIVMSMFVALAGWAGGAAGFFIAYALMMLASPASVMAMAVTDSFAEALNPARLAHIMFAVGWPYLALCFFLFSLSAGTEVLYRFFSESWSPVMLIICAQAISMYFTYIMFNMMGYVLYQYHQRLGLSVSLAFGESAERGGRPVRGPTDPVAEKIGAMVAGGNLDAGLEHAYEDQRANPFSVASHDRYHKLLLLSGNSERTLAHARRYLSLLVQQGLADQARALYEECVRSDESFQPAEGQEAMSLAAAAAAARRHDLALSLMRRFDKRYPGHRDIPRVYMLSAEILCERYRDDARATQILRLLLARYPAHEVAARAQRYLAALEKLRTDAVPRPGS